MVYTDFLSMYPTVNSLMGLWRFVTAETIRVAESCQESIRAFLNTIAADPDVLFRPDSWPRLTAFVRLVPDGDVLPIRAKFASDSQDWQVAVTQGGCDGVVLPHGLLRILHAKRCAGALQRMTFVREREREGFQIEKVSTNLVAAFGFAGLGALWNQVHRVRLPACGESDERASAIDVFDADSPPKRMALFAAIVVDIRPQSKGKATGVLSTCFGHVESKARQIMRSVERDHEHPCTVAKFEKPPTKFGIRQQSELLHPVLVDVGRLGIDVGLKHSALRPCEIRRGEEVFREALSVLDESVTSKRQPLGDIDARFVSHTSIASGRSTRRPEGALGDRRLPDGTGYTGIAFGTAGASEDCATSSERISPAACSATTSGRVSRPATRRPLRSLRGSTGHIS